MAVCDDFPHLRLPRKQSAEKLHGQEKRQEHEGDQGCEEVSDCCIGSAVAGRQSEPSVNFSFWLQADIQSLEIEVRLTPNSRHSEAHA